MKRRLLALPLLAALLLALVLGTQTGAAKPIPQPPRGFFGIVPQTPLGPEDFRYMKAGGIESIRLTLPWAGVQPTRNSPYNWGGFDAALELATRAGLRVLPAIGSPPRWATRKETTMPVATARQRKGWADFLSAAVARYGPGGEFWDQTGGIGATTNRRSPTRSRSASGRSGMSPTSSTSPTRSRPRPTRSW